MTTLIAEQWTVATDDNEVPLQINGGWGFRKPSLIEFHGEQRIKGGIEYTHERAVEVAGKLSRETGKAFQPKRVKDVIEQVIAEEAELKAFLASVGL